MVICFIYLLHAHSFRIVKLEFEVKTFNDNGSHASSTRNILLAVRVAARGRKFALAATNAL